MTTNIAKIRAALESALARATSGSRVAELRDAIAALAELEREPSDDECADIHQEWLNAHGIQGYGAVQNGRAMFAAVVKVMWPKGGEG